MVKEITPSSACAGSESAGVGVVRLRGCPARRKHLGDARALAQHHVGFPELVRDEAPPVGRRPHHRPRQGRPQPAPTQTARGDGPVPRLIDFMLGHAAPHLAAQLWTEWSTGARVSSILHGCRLCDVILAEGREQITFHDTKNGETVTAVLHPRAAQAIRDYLKVRGRLHDREGPLFLTHRGKPYSEDTEGTQNKTAFNAMKRRARKALRRATLREGSPACRPWRPRRAELVANTRAAHRLIGRVTQHWFRHMLATRFRGDIKGAMEQGGWVDERSVMGYTLDAPELRRQVVASFDDGIFGATDTPMTRDGSGRERVR